MTHCSFWRRGGICLVLPGTGPKRGNGIDLPIRYGIILPRVSLIKTILAVQEGFFLRGGDAALPENQVPIHLMNLIR